VLDLLRIGETACGHDEDIVACRLMALFCRANSVVTCRLSGEQRTRRGPGAKPFVTQRFIPDVMTIRMLAAAEPERAANGADVGEVVIALRMVCMWKGVDCRPQ
jgi:hypothetical protein